jgi:F-type H+-transporting ATPase subunit gamma
MSQSASPAYNAVAAVARSLMSRYASGDIDRVEIIHSHFQSAAKQMAVNDQLLPLDIHSLQMKYIASCGYIVEPGKIEMLDVLLPKVVELRLFASLLDSVAAEHAARVLAMQIATDNATDLISELTLEYNKGRQQAITNELLDIMSGTGSNG